MFDLFLHSFLLGEGTRSLIDHLLIVAVDRTAYNRCRSLYLNCFRWETDGVDFEGEKFYMSEDFIDMMWKRTFFLLEILKRGSWRGRHATRSSVRELLPRIYLELAILPCWRFLLDKPMDSLQHLVKMTRGLADLVASAYCRLYMAHCAQKLPSRDIGYLVTSVNDIRHILIRILSTNETAHGNLTDDKKLQVSLMEPTIEYIMKCIFKGRSQGEVSSILAEIGLRRNQQISGTVLCVSVVFHHLLKELPIKLVSSNALDILHLIECNNDKSFDQPMNYRFAWIQAV